FWVNNDKPAVSPERRETREDDGWDPRKVGRRPFAWTRRLPRHTGLMRTPGQMHPFPTKPSWMAAGSVDASARLFLNREFSPDRCGSRWPPPRVGSRRKDAPITQ